MTATSRSRWPHVRRRLRARPARNSTRRGTAGPTWRRSGRRWTSWSSTEDETRRTGGDRAGAPGRRLAGGADGSVARVARRRIQAQGTTPTLTIGPFPDAVAGDVVWLSVVVAGGDFATESPAFTLPGWTATLPGSAPGPASRTTWRFYRHRIDRRGGGDRRAVDGDVGRIVELHRDGSSAGSANRTTTSPRSATKVSSRPASAGGPLADFDSVMYDFDIYPGHYHVETDGAIVVRVMMVSPPISLGRPRTSSRSVPETDARDVRLRPVRWRSTAAPRPPPSTSSATPYRPCTSTGPSRHRRRGRPSGSPTRSSSSVPATPRRGGPAVRRLVRQPVGAAVRRRPLRRDDRVRARRTRAGLAGRPTSWSSCTCISSPASLTSQVARFEWVPDWDDPDVTGTVTWCARRRDCRRRSGRAHRSPPARRRIGAEGFPELAVLRFEADTDGTLRLDVPRPPARRRRSTRHHPTASTSPSTPTTTTGSLSYGRTIQPGPTRFEEVAAGSHVPNPIYLEPGALIRIGVYHQRYDYCWFFRGYVDALDTGLRPRARRHRTDRVHRRARRGRPAEGQRPPGRRDRGDRPGPPHPQPGRVAGRTAPPRRRRHDHGRRRMPAKAASIDLLDPDRRELRRRRLRRTGQRRRRVPAQGLAGLGSRPRIRSTGTSPTGPTRRLHRARRLPVGLGAVVGPGRHDDPGHLHEPSDGDDDRLPQRRRRASLGDRGVRA